ncbi:MAG: NCS2 family permease [Gloeomargaritaceae cyanobacterium C42_A2020_066]|nr:NCS2 family permease [Gloeomargaritaceae cyanobacterium C42_A2020_066]
MSQLMTSPRWFVPGDLDGFFGLALDNLVQILVIVNLLQGVLGFPPDLLYNRVLPGVALSLIVGNLYYSWLAHRQGQHQYRDDLTALPYGINTISLFAYIFLVMLPVRLNALAAGLSSDLAAEQAWRAGLVACLGSGLIEFGGAWIGERLRRVTPRAALLSTLGGIALTFIALGFLLRTYAHPVVALLPLGVILLTYFGEVEFHIPGLRPAVPGGLLAVLLGTGLAWGTGLVTWDAAQFQAAAGPVGLHLPRLWITDIGRDLPVLATAFSVIFPMGLFNLVGSLQNLESAEAAGDAYPAAPCLAVNGLGTLTAALFGSCFPTTIYIGHPGWKAMGARIGYSWLNGLIMGLLCLSGTVGLLAYIVPIDSGMAIVLWIGIVIVAQAFTATPLAHAPAVVVGLLPGIAGWGALVAKNALRAAGLGTATHPFTPALVGAFEASDTFITGAFALEQGLVFSAMILAAMTVHIIERQFGQAALWCGVAAGLSWVGLIHSFRWTPGDTVLNLGWGTGAEWAVGYLLVGLLLLWVQMQKPSST